MKTILTLLFVALASVGFAQQGFNYKALIKDANGNVITNDLVEIQFQILQGAAMTNVYQETHNPTTDANGIITVNIGEGTTADVFTDIDWGLDNHFLNVQINTGAGLIDMGTTQFMAVPYAKHAENAATKIDDLSDARSDPDDSSFFLGLDAGFNDDRSNNDNLGLGIETLYSNTLGEFNTAIGLSALFSNSTGSQNTAIGKSALYSNTTGVSNTATGLSALSNNTTGTSNTANGAFALTRNSIGINNTAIGSAALFYNSSGVSNTATGRGSLRSNTTGNYNTAYGSQSLYSNTSGYNNTASGWEALYSNTTGFSNVAYGHRALYSNVSGYSNTAIGNSSGFNNLGDGNIFIGYRSGYYETGGDKLYIDNYGTDTPLIYGEFDTDLLRVNGTLDINSQYSFPLSDGTANQIMLTDGAGNVGWTDASTSVIHSIDDLTDARSDSGDSSLFLGLNAGLNDDGNNNQNVAVGFEALYSNTTGYLNTAIGRNSLHDNTEGFRNTANGAYALFRTTTGHSNTANGASTLSFNTTGSDNTANGVSALSNNIIGSRNTAIGDSSGNNSIGDGNVFIGHQSGYFEKGNNKLYIANDLTTDPLIYGEFDNNLLAFHGNIGIDTKTPSTKLQILGGTNATLANGSGYLVLGDEAGANIVIDDNEIMARSNGIASSLNLQKDGGDVRVGGSVVHNSDRRLKRDINNLPYGLNEILKLQPKAYNWKNREQDYKSFGLIAQEVEPIIKEVVSVNDPETQMLGINYTELIPVLINAIQEQQEIILKQNATIEDLRAGDEAKDTALLALDQRLKQLEILMKPNN